jgi:hypothetical protein
MTRARWLRRNRGTLACVQNGGRTVVGSQVLIQGMGFAMRKAALALLLGVCAAGCSDAPNPTAHAADGSTLEPTLSMHDLMEWVLDPAADVIWASAGSVTTEDGTVDLAPTDDEGWERLRHAGAVITESASLLMLPGRARDAGEWMDMSRMLIDIGLRVSRAAEARDGDAMFEIGGELYEACLACHRRYWIDDRVATSTR